MMFPDEGGALAPQSAPDSALPPVPTSSPTPEAPASLPDSGDRPTQAQEPAPKPTLELSLREKIQKKADEVAAKHQKDPVTGKFLSKTPAPDTPSATPKVAEKAPDGSEKPVIPADKGAQAPFSPNFKVKIDKEEREIPEILRPLMKDEASAKEVRELVEKAFGLEFNKPRLEQARQQAEALTQEKAIFTGQIARARDLFQRGDIDGWLKALSVPEERILQWVADKLEYTKLPPDQKAIIDQRKQADERAQTAEQQAGHFRQQNEQILTQQVQSQLDSVLARPEIDVVAKAFDARTGKPGSFKAEVNRRGDYIWRTENRLAPPDQLVQELMNLVGPAPQQSAPSPQTPGATVVQPAARPTTPVIPNISGRSGSALPTTVKSIADLRAKHKEMQAKRS